MNERIKELAEQAEQYAFDKANEFINEGDDDDYECLFDLDFRQKFAKLIVAKVLDEVAERAYYSGDRAWSDELDRRWVELEFGMGVLAELKNEN